VKRQQSEGSGDTQKRGGWRRGNVSEREDKEGKEWEEEIIRKVAAFTWP